MRGSADRKMAMLTTVGTEDLSAADHPIGRIRVVVDEVLASLNGAFAETHSDRGWRSVSPEAIDGVRC